MCLAVDVSQLSSQLPRSRAYINNLANSNPLLPRVNHRDSDKSPHSRSILFVFPQSNLTDGEEDLPEDAFSLLSVLLVGSLNFPFDRS